MSSSGIFKTILGWMPKWVGFVLILLAGAVCLVFGLVLTPSVGVVAFGVAMIAIAILTWATGSGSTPYIDPGDPSFGASLDHMPVWVWMVNIGLVVAAVVIKLIFK